VSLPSSLPCHTQKLITLIDLSSKAVNAVDHVISLPAVQTALELAITCMRVQITGKRISQFYAEVPIIVHYSAFSALNTYLQKADVKVSDGLHDIFCRMLDIVHFDTFSAEHSWTHPCRLYDTIV